jgi:two-component system OmpR family response regulator
LTSIKEAAWLGGHKDPLQVEVFMRPPNQHIPRQLVSIVEDDVDLLDAIRFSLIAEGYGVRAHETARGMLDDPELTDITCFVVDQNLPDGDGVDLIAELRHRGLAGAAIMITTNPDARARAACRALGVPIVEKPLLGESLNACIRGILARPSA